MIAVEQRSAYDCLTACLSSIFEVPYEDVPLFCDQETGEPIRWWRKACDDWLAERGWAQLERVRQTDEGGDPMRCPWRFPGYWIAGVKSPRYDGSHAVVMHRSELVWDPNPQREMGHLGFEDATYFLPLSRCDDYTCILSGEADDDLCAEHYAALKSSARTAESEA